MATRDILTSEVTTEEAYTVVSAEEDYTVHALTTEKDNDCNFSNSTFYNDNITENSGKLVFLPERGLYESKRSKGNKYCQKK